jgi:hypothetical protein
VPIEPQAATRPTVWLRFSTGVARETVPISTPKPVPAAPIPIMKPAISSAPGKERETSMSSNPAA